MIEKTLVDKLLKKIKVGGVTVTYWDGDTRTYGALKKPRLHVAVKDAKVVRAMMKNPSLAIGEAYMDGRLTVRGPLEQLALLGFQNQDVFDLKGLGLKFKGFHRNFKKDQAKLIHGHYDLGNDFYEMWLDPETLGYTCSYYKTPDDTLEEGQRQKFNHVLEKLQIKKGQTLLDIGFGWGYLLIHAAKKYGVRGFGVSLSREQLDFAQAWAKREKVDKLVTFKLMNYQDLPKLKQQFDRVVSIGFFEHVGKGHHPIYFDVVNKMLKPDGISVLHCITQSQDGAPDPWFDKYIFPGGYAPGVPNVTDLIFSRGFVVKDYENIGPHYVKTLQQWWERFEEHKDEVIAMYDERFYRMWQWYLASCVAAFAEGALHLSQWTFTRLPGADWPLTRDYLYK